VRFPLKLRYSLGRQLLPRHRTWSAWCKEHRGLHGSGCLNDRQLASYPLPSAQVPSCSNCGCGSIRGQLSYLSTQHPRLSQRHCHPCGALEQPRVQWGIHHLLSGSLAQYCAVLSQNSTAVHVPHLGVQHRSSLPISVRSLLVTHSAATLDLSACFSSFLACGGACCAVLPRRPPLKVQRDVKASGYALLQVTGAKAGGGEQDLPFGVASPVDVPLLLSFLGLSSFDLIRMDIEGSEMKVLSSRTGYVMCTAHWAAESRNRDR